MDLPTEIPELEARYWGRLNDDEEALEKELERSLRGVSSLSREEVEFAAKWKMSTQDGRAGWTIDALRKVTDEDIGRITGSAIAVSDLRTQIDVLRELPGVGVGVSTSILGFVFPETRVVVDYNTYNGVFDKDVDSVTSPRAVELTERLRKEYGDSDHSLREVDRALFVAFGSFEE